MAGEDLEDWQCEMAVVHARCLLLLVRVITDRGAYGAEQILKILTAFPTK